MNGRFLLDTNILIALFAADHTIQRHLNEPGAFYVPVVALGELYYGALKSSRVDENVARIDQLAASSSLLGCDNQTSRHYGEIKNNLRAKGRPIPENDIWIAAVAKQYRLTVV
ncbi:MAG: type II toxin-antitoxin system VapC family toxin [Pyrinomonadaceae bacterium]